jgi:hypothetical protein
VTVITALKAHGKVFMAADSMSSDSTGLIWDGSMKLFEKRCADGQRLICGNTGNASAGAVFQYALKIEKTPETDAHAWAQQVAFDYTKLCKQLGEVDDKGQAIGCVLMACGPDVWEISDNFAQSVENYVSVGGGAQVAQGALFAQLEWVDDYYYPPADEARAIDMVRIAVTAACRWERSCRLPVNVLVT